MAAREEVRAVIIGEDRASDAFSKVGRSVGDMSGKMDFAAKSSDYLDDALKRQRKTALVTADATLALAKSDEILAEVEKRLKDGALEAELALKKEAEALKGVRHEADRLDGKKVKVKVEVDRSAWSRFAASITGGPRGTGFLGRLGNLVPGLAGTGAGASGFGALAATGLLNPYTIGAGLIASPFAGQAAAGLLPLLFGGDLAGLGILGAFGGGKAPTQLQLTAAQDRLIAAQAALAKLQGSGKASAGQLAGAEGSVASAQDSLNKLQAQAIDPAQAKMRKSFTSLTSDIQDSLVQIGKPFQPVMTDILKTAKTVLDDMTPIFAAAEKVIAGPFKVFGDTLLKSFGSQQVMTSIEAVANAFGKLLTALAPGIPGDVNEIATGITKVADAVAANPKAFATFVNDLFKIGQVALSVIADLAKTATYIEAHFRPALHRVAVIFDGVRHEVAHISDDMQSALIRTWGATWNDTIGIAIRFGHNIENVFDRTRHGTAVIFDGARHEIAHIWDQVWNNTVGRAQRGVADVVRFVGSLPGKIAALFRNAGSWLYGAGKWLVQGLLNGIESIGSSIGNFLYSLIPSWARRFITGLTGGSSRSGTGSGVTPSFGPGSGGGHAAGTNWAPPGWAWVGERGPELMRFRGGEQVMSAPASSAYAQARGGVTEVHVHVHVDPTVAAVTPDRQLGRHIAEHVGAYVKGGGRLYPAGTTPR